MALSADGAMLGIYNYYDGQFVLIDTATRTILAQFPVPTGLFDDELSFSPDGTRAYVTNYSANRVLVLHIAGAASALEATILGIASAGSLSVDAAGQFLYVGGQYGEARDSAVYVISTATNSVVRTVVLGPSINYGHTSYLSHADSVLYVTAYTWTATILRTGTAWSRQQALYRVRAAGDSSSLIDVTPLTSTPAGFAFSESLKSAFVGLPDVDGIDRIDLRGGQADGTYVVTLGPGQTLTKLDFGNRASEAIPPTVTISRQAPVAERTGADQVTFLLRFSEGVSQVDAGDFELNLGGTVAASGVVVGDAADGDASTYTVTVSDITGDGLLDLDFAAGQNIVDRSGNGLVPATGIIGEQTYTIDNTAPAAPTVTGITEDTDTPGDGITRDPTLVIHGTAEATQTVQVFRDGIRLGTAAADTAGDWNFDNTHQPLPAGTYALTARAFDSAGNVSPLSSPFLVTIVLPEIQLQGNGQTIADGDATPTAADHTDFGVADVGGGQVTRTFTIQNTGTAVLTLTGTPPVRIVGAHAADFAVTAQPPASISAGGSTTFAVTFDPSASGVRTATVKIENNDADESVYDFAIQGAGLGSGIGGLAWLDGNADGQRDPGEPGLAGVTVYLDLNQDGQLNGGEPNVLSASDDPATTAIDETGSYALSGLDAGTYHVAQIPPAGYEPTSPAITQGGTGLLSFVASIQDDQGGIGGLDGAYAAATSPAGEHIYVAGAADDAVAVFARNANTGELSFVQAVRDGAAGVDGLDSASDLSVSLDGKHVYVTGSNDQGLAVFARNATTGELTFVTWYRDGLGGVDGLSGASSVAVSSDGLHVYVAGRFDDAVAVFSRNATTGQLTFVEVVRDGANGVDGLSRVISVVVSIDGEHVYAASYGEHAIAVFSRNPTTGRLTFVEMQQDGVSGVDGLQNAQSVTISPGGDSVYVAGGGDDAIAVFRRDADTGELTFLEVIEDGLNGVDGLDGAACVRVDAAGTHLYAAGLADNAVAVFSRDSVTGRLTFVHRLKDGVDGVNGLDRARGLVIPADGDHVYAVGEFDDAVVVFDRDAASGQLAFVAALLDSQGGVDGLNYAWGVAVSPEGNQVYVAGYNDNSITQFDRDAATGQLTYVQTHYDNVAGVDGLSWAVDVAISEDGKHVYVTGSADSAIALFARDVVTGQLTFVERLTDSAGGGGAIGGAMDMALSPDGRHVYVAARFDNAVSVFSRNLQTGRLTFVQNYQDAVTLNYTEALTVSPDGAYVYVAGLYGDALLVFSRDSVTGQLTLFQTLEDGVDGIDGLNNPSSVAVSRDSKYVYVTGNLDHSLTVFERNSTTGQLALVQFLKDGVGGVDGLGYAYFVTFAPDESQVYVAGYFSEIGVFNRNATTGQLTYAGVIKNGGSVSGLAYPKRVTLSPDGRDVYVTSTDHDAVTLLSRNYGSMLPQAHVVHLATDETREHVDFGARTAIPEVSIGDVSQPEGQTGTTDFDFTVTLSYSSNQVVTVAYATQDGTATVADNDYQAVSNTLTFQPGQTQKTITVPVAGDLNVEGDETFSVVLSSPTNATLAQATATGTITNDDPYVGVQLVAVQAPSATGSSALPAGLASVTLGSTYYVEVWVQDLLAPGVGISGGKVDVNYSTSVVDAVAVVNQDFDLLPDGTIDDPNGVVRDLGGGTLQGGLGVAPQWARLGYVEMLSTALGEATFALSPGSLQFGRFGAGDVDWSLVDLGTPTAVDQIGGTRIDLTIVAAPSATAGNGEVATLPASEAWVHEWMPFWVEIWVSTPVSTATGIAEATVDLQYDTGYLTATEIQYGPAFTQNLSGTIDDAQGRVTAIGGATLLTDVGDDAYVLLARVRFASTGSDQAPVDEAGRNIGPYDMQLALSSGQAQLVGAGAAVPELGSPPATELWAVVYDIDDNNLVDFGDLAFFAPAFGLPVAPSGSEPPFTWWADFDKSGLVDFGDLSFFAPNFSKSRAAGEPIVFPPAFPAGWSNAPQQLVGTFPGDDAAMKPTSAAGSFKTSKLTVLEPVVVSPVPELPETARRSPPASRRLDSGGFAGESERIDYSALSPRVPIRPVKQAARRNIRGQPVPPAESSAVKSSPRYPASRVMAVDRVFTRLGDETTAFADQLPGVWEPLQDDPSRMQVECGRRTQVDHR